MWSVSESRMFRRCPRQWYYKNIVASAIAKDERRRRVFRLSKLQSVQAWRGQIVDEVISALVIDRLQSKREITLSEAKHSAHRKFERELAFARSHRDLTAESISSPDFVALHALYYHGSIDQAELDAALQDVDQALSNLFKMDEIKNAIK